MKPGERIARRARTWISLAARRSRTGALALTLIVGALVAAACGSATCGGPCGQGAPANEPKGNYPVDVLQASFPTNQHLAKDSTMAIVVRNAGSKTIPQISVTVKCGSSLGGTFDTVQDQSDVPPDQQSADPSRPQFVVKTIPIIDAQSVPSSAEAKSTVRPQLDPSPEERTSAYVDTYPLGPLPPGQTANFRWNVSAVKAGSFQLCWRVNAGYVGRAFAVASANSPLPINGTFNGTVSDTAPKADIGPDGTTVVNTR